MPAVLATVKEFLRSFGATGEEDSPWMNEKDFHNESIVSESTDVGSTDTFSDAHTHRSRSALQTNISSDCKHFHQRFSDLQSSQTNVCPEKDSQFGSSQPGLTQEPVLGEGCANLFDDKPLTYRSANIVKQILKLSDNRNCALAKPTQGTKNSVAQIRKPLTRRSAAVVKQILALSDSLEKPSQNTKAHREGFKKKPTMVEESASNPHDRDQMFSILAEQIY
jgi:hypothetical protein